MFKNLLNILMESGLSEQPITVPTKPAPTKAPVRPSRRTTPLKPAPGIHPKPKANRDVELFKQARKNQGVEEMAFDPGMFPSFIHPSKKKWIETGDEELDALFPTLTEGEQSYLEMITSHGYQEMVSRLEKYTGIEADEKNLPQIMSLVFQSIEKAVEIESKDKKRFEDLALEIVLDMPEFEMVKEAYENKEIEFDVKLATPELGYEEGEVEAEEGELTDTEQINLALAKEFEGLSEEKLRRRLANILIQGSAVLKLYLFNMASEELNKIDSNLMDLYGILAVVVQLGYWIYPTGFEEGAVENIESQMGSEEVIPSGDDYIIKVRARVFPYLIHELVKGIYEWVSLDPELRDAMKSDSIGKETEDIIVGPGVFKVLSSYVPSAEQRLMPLVQKKFLQLSRDEVKEVLDLSSEGKRIMKELVDQAREDWDEYKRGAYGEYQEDEGEEEEEEVF